MSDREYPILVTRDLIIFPSNSMPLTVASRRNRKAIDAAIESDGLILVVPVATHAKTGEATPDDLHRFGTVCKVDRSKSDSQNYQVILNGLYRAEIERISYTPDDKDIILGSYFAVDSHMDIDSETLDKLLSSGKGIAIEILKLSQGNGAQKLSDIVRGLDDPEVFIYLCASNLDLGIEEKLELLKTISIKYRLLKIIDILHMRKNSLQVQVEINHKLSNQMDKKQREVILREQLQTIREELGDMDESGSQLDYIPRIESSAMPDSVKKIAIDEAHRLEATPSASPEAPNIRNYLDLLLDLPWGNPEHEDIDITDARDTLDADHHGLTKVKNRIIQHLAVTQLNKGQQGVILLLVGPPGVGKTSLGRSIAKAMNREFVRISLGGVRDEAEIRGHRRTYLGSMPGRIIQGIKRAQVNNPVFLLDEIDKLSQGWGGDPSGALLEVLDPEQNNSFEDHYMDVPYDLSHVMFIATANSLEGIPGPLRDRMEIIQVSGYTTAEKFHIAKNHLWQSEIKRHGLIDQDVAIEDSALESIVHRYTRESGVRDLKRKLASVCRHLSEDVLTQDRSGTRTVVESELEDILGPEPFNPESAQEKLPAGVVTGLAWTPMGGEILFIESKLMPGKGKLTITGQLGDVMKESLHIAMSHVRSHMHKINRDFDYERYDIHVHVPAGAIPKDGPSAGITMVTSLISLLSHRLVSPKLAMSGELTLRGAVMPVGGIKEKVIAAHRAGIDTIILSSKNQKDLREVPEEVKKDVKFHFADTIEDVISKALSLELELNEVFTTHDYDHHRPQILS
ncbi:endopeptidase La [Pseudobacteriovorax antillogorgiicola]|uniref:Lon protease n=1 Tax=Pseudobacteriovorax antillogorgiicola TaxID=1513793 RepID=A0A1Y6CIJ9_9BACT|nr:endopeptidase La [Pseudobacteriovorax antillogorgiicola]TCS46346.1 ATP-dependent Lon protease [Pseudobacteriovorax antillogorgiicola]SMF68088.1 ATP-dependent Lon protease [Pseudobacteriovorax antillogorgiicola]